MHTVFAPNYGSPFVRDLDGGRRYGTIEDFRNLVKLTYASPYMHHSGGTVCEPVDVPVNKRHLDMVYSHIRYSDKPFMGSVTAPERARDTVEMARLAFGADYLEDHAVILSPHQRELAARLGRDRCLGAARAYAEANQATLLTPFILAGAMAPVTAAGGVRPDTRRGARRHDVRPAGPARCARRARKLRELDVDAVGGADIRDAGAGARPVRHGRARPTGSASRSGPVGRSAPRRSPTHRPPTRAPHTLQPTVLGGVNFVLHAAGWLEGGLTVGYEKFVLDADQLGMMTVFVNGVDLSDNGQALEAILGNEPGTHYLGSAHTLANFESAFYRSDVADNNSFEQWQEDGSLDAAQRANAIWKRTLARVRGAADRSRRRRGAPRLHRPAQGGDAGFRGLAPRAVSPPCVAHAGECARARGCPACADVRARTAQERARAGELPAAGCHRVGDGVSGEGDRGDRRAVRAAPGGAVFARCRISRRGWSGIAATSPS